MWKILSIGGIDLNVVDDQLGFEGSPAAHESCGRERRQVVLVRRATCMARVILGYYVNGHRIHECQIDPSAAARQQRRLAERHLPARRYAGGESVRREKAVHPLGRCASRQSISFGEHHVIHGREHATCLESPPPGAKRQPVHGWSVRREHQGFAARTA